MEIDLPAVDQICTEHRIDIKTLKPLAGSFGKRIFVINQALLLRVSATPMTREQEKYRRVAGLNFVPQIVYTGMLKRDAEPLYYTLLTLLPGDDFVNVYPETPPAQQRQLGEAVARFIDNLQALQGTQYDIGLYVPALPPFAGTWREGHQHYWAILQQAAEQSPLPPETARIFARAYRFLEASAAVLDFQSGPKLLHNDLHPKNIIVDQGRFAGVIDWECSQFGEADFELCHFIHWCLYPPQSHIDFRTFLRALFEASPQCTQVPDLAQRLAIYQVEHELQQIIWQGSAVAAWRAPRLVRWMDGGVDELLREIGVTTTRPTALNFT